LLRGLKAQGLLKVRLAGARLMSQAAKKDWKISKMSRLNLSKYGKHILMQIALLARFRALSSYFSPSNMWTRNF
jgi:hypothetical protein